MTAEIYSVHSISTPGMYSFQKFDNDLNFLKRYVVSEGECNCPRGETGKQCRHRDMLKVFIRNKHISDGFMYNYNTRQWIKPPDAIAEAVTEQAPAPEAQVLASPPASAQAVSGVGATLGPTYKRRI